MRVLLDTHVLLWAGLEPERLAPRVRDLLVDPSNDLVWSVVGTVEIAIKAGTGRLRLPGTAGEYVERKREEMGLEFLPLEHRHAVLLAALPPLHGDPFDRLLVAQARAEGIPLVTSDRALAAYGVEVLW